MNNKKHDDELVLLPIGGAGEIGMNIYLYGWGPKTNRKWLIVDVGGTEASHVGARNDRLSRHSRKGEQDIVDRRFGPRHRDPS